MTTLFRHCERNTRGRDLAVGDIHGHFSRLTRALWLIGFDPGQGDRLFSVGDLVDRGPESIQVLDWLAKPWFIPVMGNHDEMALRFGKPDCRMDVATYAANGGAWNIANDQVTRGTVSAAMSELPVAIEVETAAGRVGIVHAGCPTANWVDFRTALSTGWESVDGKHQRMSRNRLGAMCDAAMWDRSRVEHGDTQLVAGIDAVVVGHTPMKEPLTLGNVHHIDTGGWLHSGRFTLLDLNTLRPIEATP